MKEVFSLEREVQDGTGRVRLQLRPHLVTLAVDVTDRSGPHETWDGTSVDMGADDIDELIAGLQKMKAALAEAR